MIGEDFRSRASENLICVREAEQKILELNEEIKELKRIADDKDLELVIQDRKSESYQMESEEHLTLFDNMRTQALHFEKLFDQQASLALTRQMKIEEITLAFAEKEKSRLDCKEDKECQTFIGAKYFENKKNDNSSRNGSGSLGSGSQRTAGAPAPSGGKRVGGGGVIAKRPPPRPNVNGSRNADGLSQGSKGLRMDTTSSHRSKAGASNLGDGESQRQQSANRS